MNFVIFRKVVVASRHGIYRVFGPGASRFAFSRFSIGTKKMPEKKVTPIRGGITSGSAFFDLFVHI